MLLLRLLYGIAGFHSTSRKQENNTAVWPKSELWTLSEYSGSLKPKYRTRSYPNAPSSSSSSPSDVFLLSKQRCRRRCPLGPSSPRRHARTREALTNECDNSWVGTAGGVSEWTVRQGRGNAMQHLSDRLRASEWRNLTCVVITEVDEEVSNGIIHIETDTDVRLS